jgi:transcriptional regulator with XRE-family HTH domain
LESAHASAQRACVARVEKDVSPIKAWVKGVSKELGEHLARHRRNRKRTQRGVGQALGAQQPFVSKIEKGEYLVKLVELLRLAAAYDLTPEAIFAWLRRHAANPPDVRRLAGAGVSVEAANPPARKQVAAESGLGRTKPRGRRLVPSKRRSRRRRRRG